MQIEDWDLIDWYKNQFTPSMVNWSNVSPARMDQNLAVLRDAISSYRQWLGETQTKRKEEQTMGLTESSFEGHAEKQHDAFATIQEKIRENKRMEDQLLVDAKDVLSSFYSRPGYTAPPESIPTSEVEVLNQQLSILKYQCAEYNRLASDDTELAKFLQGKFGAEPEWQQGKFKGDSTGAIAIYFLKRGTRPSIIRRLRRWLGW